MKHQTLVKKIEKYFTTHQDTVTLKQIQSALKIKGLTCNKIYQTLRAARPFPYSVDTYGQAVSRWTV